MKPLTPRRCVGLSPLAVVLALAVGCMRPVTPPPPSGVHTIAVLPPNNRTGDDLLVAGTSLLERTLGAERVTVPDVLAVEAEDLLRERGYAGAPAAARGTGAVPTSVEDAARMASRSAPADAVLYLEIRRWEPDSPTHPAFVIVGVSATLIDAATGREIWRAHAGVHPVATPGVVALGSAYAVAARKVIVELFARW